MLGSVSPAQVIPHPEGLVEALALDNGRRRLTVKGRGSSGYTHVSSCETAYPMDLIELILEVKGPGWLCDEIQRDQDPLYVRHNLESAFRPFVDLAEVDGRRILDLGSGTGASTMILSRMFPASEIVGVELEPDLLAIAKRRAEVFRASNVAFFQSPSGTRLPEGIGTFHVVVMSAVFEHLLPRERPALMRQVWSVIRPGGLLVIQETPHRFFPLESHTTGLALINHLPDAVAHAMTRRFSRRVDRGASWEELLRQGIRGGTAREVVGTLRGDTGYRPHMLRPTRGGARGEFDVWYAMASAHGRRSLRRSVAHALRAFKMLTGYSLMPYITLQSVRCP